MDVSIAETAAWLRQREDERRRRVNERLSQLRASVPHAVRVLRENYGASRIWLFGSVATGEVDERSDLDLAVEGISSQSYFNALSELLRNLGHAIDLVRVEEAPPMLLERIRLEGREL
jgi:predicted nucleotidyltransferase